MRADVGTSRELFPPPEAIAEGELEDVLWLVEGEPDAVRMWSLGLAAVAVPGAQNWRDTWAPRFAGRGCRVVVCFDCDEAGRANAPRASRALLAAGVDARVLDLSPNRDDGYDLSDFLSEARTESEREEARRILERSAEMVPPFSEPESPEGVDDVAPEAVESETRTVEEWSVFRDATPENPRYLVEGLIPEGALVFVAGPPKKGKTWVGIGLALTTSTGQPLCGEFPVSSPRNVLYVALEGSRIGLRARIGALARGLGIDPDGDDLDRLHLLYRPRPFDLTELATAEWLHEQALRLDAALVVIDVLRAAARFRETEAADFAQVRDSLAPLLASGCAVALLHHFGKLTETQKERSPGERMAGTGAMYGALDVGLLITRSENGARRLRVDIEARDFAAPEPLGVVILGTGSGEHGGFTYADTATLALDPGAAEERDLAHEIEELLGDAKWRTLSELYETKENGIGANKTEVEATLRESPERFARVEPKRVGRHATAKPWGTTAMLRALEAEEKVVQASELPELPLASKLDAPQVEQVAPPKGEPAEPPAPPTASEVVRPAELPELPAASEDAPAAGDEEER
jgi:hypothetical protein